MKSEVVQLARCCARNCAYDARAGHYANLACQSNESATTLVGATDADIATGVVVLVETCDGKTHSLQKAT